jgi:hypothetical protein
MEPKKAPSFNDFVGKFAGRPNELPLVHNTTCSRLREITGTGSLDPRPCPVFNEPLIYFFYGRPIFRPRGPGDSPDTRVVLCPVCLIFKPRAIEPWSRVFPFDSGAASGGRFDPLIPAAHRDRYLLQSTISTARRVVEAFFDTNNHYYLGDPRKLLDNGGVEEVQKYFTLISSTGPAEFDDRRSAIEVQSRKAIALRDNLYAVILPAAFLDVLQIREAVVSEWRAIPITYETHRGAVPNEYVRVIVEKFRSLFDAAF